MIHGNLEEETIVFCQNRAFYGNVNFSTVTLLPAKSWLLSSKVFWLALLWMSIIAGVEMILTRRLWGCCGWFKVGSCWMNAKEVIKG